MTEISPFFLEDRGGGDGSGLGPENAVSKTEGAEPFFPCSSQLVAGPTTLRPDNG